MTSPTPLADAFSVCTLRLRTWTRRWRHTSRVVYRTTALNMRARMAYRGDFVTSVLYGVLWQAATLAVASVLLTRFSSLGGFPAEGVLLLVGLRLTAHGLYVLVFDNLDQVPRLIDEGRMEGYLLRPLPVLTQVLLCQFNVNAFGDILVGVTTLGFAVTVVDVDWTAGAVLYLAAAVVGGVLVEAAVHLFLACLQLRSPAVRGFESWVDEMMATFGNYPLSILPQVIQGFFTFLLPLAFVAYFPVLALTGRTADSFLPGPLITWSPLAGFLLFFLATKAWRSSINRFHSAGG